MVSEQDGFEQSARIVEAFASGQSNDVADLLAEIAKAIREKAIDACKRAVSRVLRHSGSALMDLR